MLRCSFCRRPDSEVAKLVAGPARLLFGRVYICDRCVGDASRIMDAHPGELHSHVHNGSLFNRTLNRLTRWRHKALLAAAWSAR
jgi:hypothetical protein